MADPFRSAGDWLRCALHAHATNSDGELAPAALAEHYRRAGYDVLAITDHWHRTDASSDGLLVIASSEVNCLLPGERDGHVLAFGIDSDPLELLAQRPDLPAATEWISRDAGVAYLAHPYWSGAPLEQLELPAAVAGIEVYNAGCEG